MTSMGPFTGSSRSPQDERHSPIDLMPGRVSCGDSQRGGGDVGRQDPCILDTPVPARPPGSRCRFRRRRCVRTSSPRSRRSQTASTMSSVSGLGMSTSRDTSKSSPQNSRRPMMKATGSCVARRSMSAEKSRSTSAGIGPRPSATSLARSQPRAWRARTSASSRGVLDRQAQRARAPDGHRRFVRGRRSLFDLHFSIQHSALR